MGCANRSLTAGMDRRGDDGRLVAGADDRYVDGLLDRLEDARVGRSVLRDRGQARRPRVRRGGVEAARAGRWW